MKKIWCYVAHVKFLKVTLGLVSDCFGKRSMAHWKCTKCGGLDYVEFGTYWKSETKFD